MAGPARLLLVVPAVADTILVIDDDREFLDIVRTALTAHGYQVIAVDNAEAALSLLETTGVDVVVSDVMMPGLNGLQLLRRARARIAAIKVVLMTGYGTREIAMAAWREGAYALLEKPFDRARLLLTVEAARHGAAPAQPEDGRALPGEPGERGAERRLAAILNADVAGYSRLMHDDELATVATLNAHREVIGHEVLKNRGRIVDAPGDNVLSEFPSVLDAVGCSVAVQQALVGRNAQLPESRRMEFRIGVHVGEVVVDRGRLYGAVLNIAARVERLAEAGGICVTAAVYEQIKGRLDVDWEDLGRHALKNIAEPVQVYRVRVAARRGPRKDRPALSDRADP